MAGRQETDPDSVPIAEAAKHLGMTADAVRKRLQRGTLAGEKRGGAWFVAASELSTSATDDPRVQAVRPSPSGRPAAVPDRDSPSGQEASGRQAGGPEPSDALRATPGAPSPLRRLWRAVRGG